MYYTHIINNKQRFTQEYYLKPTLEVAQDLLGKIIVCGKHAGIITETEAYIGADDPACHAARGKTKSNAHMFLAGGHSYVYFIYGMYHCLNIVTEAEDFPAAVLIRGIKLVTEPYLHLDGPGKLCKFLGINKEHSSVNLAESNYLYLLDSMEKPNFTTYPRVAISAGKDKLWRFVVEND